MTTVPVTPAPSVLVATACLGPRMPRHRVLLGVATACGVPVGASWIRESAPHGSVDCAVCLEAGREFREGQRRNA